MLVAICLALPAAATLERTDAKPGTGPAPSAPRKSGPGIAAKSRVLGKTRLTLRGKPACEVRFVYAGREPENLFWKEACPAVTARMLTQQELRAIGRWDRLDSFARSFVSALPGGKVLYVEGSSSVSVYPVGTTGSTHEVPVAD